MAKEDGITGAVDHIHRSIYAATSGSKPQIWMRPKNADHSKAPVGLPDHSHTASMAEARRNKGKNLPTSTIQELESEEGSGVMRGILLLPSKIRASVSNLASSMSNIFGGSNAPTPSGPTTPSLFNRVTPPNSINGVPPAAAGAAASAPAALGGSDAPAAAQSSKSCCGGGVAGGRAAVPMADEAPARKKGLFSWLGC